MAGRILDMCLPLLLCTLGRASLSTHVVQTECGAVRGVVDGGAIAYKGIPYAAPPTGQRRFAPPEPVTRAGAPSCWRTGVRDASSFGQACMQFGGPQPGTGSEDCLTINVWSPAVPRPSNGTGNGTGNGSGNGSGTGTGTGTGTGPDPGIVILKSKFAVPTGVLDPEHPVP